MTTDPTAILCDVRTGLKFSTDPEHYESRCRSCHVRYDRGVQRAIL